MTCGSVGHQLRNCETEAQSKDSFARKRSSPRSATISRLSDAPWKHRKNSSMEWTWNGHKIHSKPFPNDLDSEFCAGTSTCIVQNAETPADRTLTQRGHAERSKCTKLKTVNIKCLIPLLLFALCACAAFCVSPLSSCFCSWVCPGLGASNFWLSTSDAHGVSTSNNQFDSMFFYHIQDQCS